MGLKFKYYCLPDIAVDDKRNNLTTEFRICKFPENSSLVPIGFVGFETLEELKKKDSVWRNYYNKNSKSAEKICQKQFIVEPVKAIVFPSYDEFSKVSYKLIKHTVFGELNKDIQGIHLFSKFNKSITKIDQIKAPDKRGVWVARIEYFSEFRQKTYVKDESSMFPLNWDATRYMFEIFEAYKNRKMCKSDSTVFHSFTLSGIPVDFIIKDGMLRTVYPKYDN